MDKINVICEMCNQEIPLHTSNKRKTEEKIISGKLKCPRCKHGKLKIFSNK